MAVTRLEPSFHRLWAATALSNVGDGLVVVGAPLIAVGLTRSPFLVSLVSAAATLPWLLFALPVGALVDRHDRRVLLAAANWGRAAVLLVFAAVAWLDLLHLPLLLASLLLAGACEVVSDSTGQSLTPMVVPQERLPVANGRLFAAQTVGNNFVGAPLAGLLLGALGQAALLAAPALLYTGAAAMLVGLRGRFRVQSDTAGVRADIVAGLRFLRDHRVLRSLALFAGLFNFASAAYFAVFVLWVVGDQSRVRLEAGGYGLLMVALAAGAIGGSLLMERQVRSLPRVLIMSAVLNSLLLLVPVVVPVAAVIGVVAVLMGATSAMFNVAIQSLRQQLTPESILGRVNATARLIGMGTMPIGALAGGVLGDHAGLPAVFCAAAALCLVAVAIAGRSVTARAVASRSAAAST
ncbi:MFS transporter [Nonomuraea recticatena]|uniref:MFS transporter n=1 Tax=Nonomuraea recticatena TaxID=46178 RepID=A0ABN3T8S7_9ACTN